MLVLSRPSGQRNGPGADAVKVLRQTARRVRHRAGEAPWAQANPASKIKDVSLGRQEGVALTFDDGPDPGVTPLVLDELQRWSATATFFLCGVAARRYPELVAEIVGRGHAVGSHTWDHRPVAGMDGETWRASVLEAHRSIERLVGHQSHYFRPPYGRYDRSTLTRLRAAGISCVMWSIDSQDWTQTDPSAIADRVVQRLTAGSIVLLHDGCGDLLPEDGVLAPGAHGDPQLSARALPDILAAIRDGGLVAEALPEPSHQRVRWLVGLQPPPR